MKIRCKKCGEIIELCKSGNYTKEELLDIAKEKPIL